jgi:hypothetical protein
MTYNAFVERFENARKSGNGIIVKCPAHEDSTASLSIGRSRNGGVLLKCFAGCETENIVSAMGLTLRDLFAEEPIKAFHVSNGNGNGATVEKPIIEKVYSYTDPLGRELFQVVRLKPKSFRQRHGQEGAWIWSMDGVERVLYRLPEIQKTETVWIVEGEKDADNLCALGFIATCNVGGAGKWLDGYTASLAGKDVVLCGDNDEPGKKHMELVFDSIATRVQSVRIIKLPGTFKDVSDYLASFEIQEDRQSALQELHDAATPHVGGVRMPVYSMADIELLYKKQVDQSTLVSLDLGEWLPSFRNRIRPIIPGEMMLIIGDTGTGKTALIQNIAMNTRLKSLMFEMELPIELVYERFFAIKAKMQCTEIEQEYRNVGAFGKKSVMEQFPNLFICPESRMTLEQLESIILKSELKIGEKPVLVLVDYVQLIQGAGNRYEKTSNIAEGLKIIAKATRTIIVIASQISRASSDEEIGLHSGKDSGALENSAGLVLAAWRNVNDPGLLTVKVLKSTKGGSGLEIPCNFDGSRMSITERSKFDSEINATRRTLSL